MPQEDQDQEQANSLPHATPQELADQLWAIKDIRQGLDGAWESLREIDMVIANLEAMATNQALPAPSWKTA